MKQASRYFSIL